MHLNRDKDQDNRLIQLIMILGIVLIAISGLFTMPKEDFHQKKIDAIISAIKKNKTYLMDLGDLKVTYSPSVDHDFTITSYKSLKRNDYPIVHMEIKYSTEILNNSAFKKDFKNFCLSLFRDRSEEIIFAPTYINELNFDYQVLLKKHNIDFEKSNTFNLDKKLLFMN